MEISIFDNAWQMSNGKVTSIDEFNNDVKFGKWKDHFELVSKEGDKKKRQELKKKMPYVTISGKFSERNSNGLIKHSGFICLDFDNFEDVDKAFEKIASDPYVHSAFKSISGTGVAALVKIDGNKHLDAFLGLEVYFANKYQLYIDPACKDITRARFVSYDPDLSVNVKSEKFTKYLPKSENIPKNKLPNVITGSNDIDYILNQIRDSNIDITGSDYSRWLKIGFALADELNEAGRAVYHSISQYSDKYSSERCDKQFNHCLKAKGHGVTFATFLFYVKSAGLSIVSDETKQIVTVAGMTKSGGRGVGDAVRVLKEIDGIPEEVSREIVEKVFKQENISESSKLTKLESLEIFLNHNYDLKRNEVTRFIELNKEEIDTKFLNSVYIKVRKEVDDKVKFDEIDRLISSDFTPDYNPLKEFFERNNYIEDKGLINKLADSLSSDTGNGSDYVERFLTKWIVGLVASIHGEHSPLLLVLTGGYNTGKTEFFRRLLPEELKPYYAESKLDAGKDDDILMCQKILILDDEFGGKSKMEAKRLKELTSKDYFTLREPYGRKNVRLKRLAVLCGTSNETQLLNDPTGNRRIIPINITGYNFEAYNSIDKTSLLMEAFRLYESGFNFRMTKEDIELLNNHTDNFEQVRSENELIKKYFKIAEKGQADLEYLQATEIKSVIEEYSGQRLSAMKIPQELKSLGYNFETMFFEGVKRKVYPVIRLRQESLVRMEGEAKVMPISYPELGKLF